MTRPQIYPWKRNDIEKAFHQAKLLDSSKAFPADEITNAIIGATAHMISKSTYRTNLITEKAKSHFISFAGHKEKLPEPTIIPVSFTPCDTSSSITIPKGTQISTSSRHSTKSAILETLSPLVVTKSDLVKFVVADLAEKQFTDKSHLIGAFKDESEELFNTHIPLKNQIHLHHPFLEKFYDRKGYWIQLFFVFKTPQSELHKTTTPHSTSLSDKDAISPLINDFPFFSLSYKNEDGTTKSHILKSDLNGICEIEDISDNVVRSRSIFIPRELATNTVTGIETTSGIYRKEDTFNARFITLGIATGTNSHSGVLGIPNLVDIRFEIFDYNPDTETDKISTPKSTYKPHSESIINIKDAFYNNKRLDLTRPFKPFGDFPKVGDTFSFASNSLNIGKSDKCEINIGMIGDFKYSSASDKSSETNPLLKDEYHVFCSDILLNWEYYNGNDWKTLATVGHTKEYTPPTSPEEFGEIINSDNNVISNFNFCDSSNCLTQSSNRICEDHSPISFTIPNDFQRAKLHNTNAWWIRIRILRGGYSRDTEFCSLGRIVRSEIIHPPIIENFTVNYYKCADNESSNIPATPFSSIIRCDDFSSKLNGCSIPVLPIRYNSNDNFISNISPMIFLGFRNFDINNRHRTLFFSISNKKQSLPLSHYFSPEKDREAPNHIIPRLYCEYWNGKNWLYIDVKDYSKIFTSSQNIEFSIPKDSVEQTIFNSTLHWIRISIDYEATQHISNNNYVSTTFLNNIKINGIHQNIVLTASFETIKNEIIGNSTGTANQKFHFLSSPIAANPIIHVRESYSSLPRNSLLTNERENSAISAVENKKNVNWIEWEEVDNFLYSTSTDRHYIIDHSNGLILFGDGKNGKIPPAGLQNIMAKEYRRIFTDPNLNHTKNDVKYHPEIRKVTCLPILESQNNIRDIGQIFSKACETIKVFNRVVTARDFEIIAYNTSQDIEQAKALQGIRPDGTYQPGFVTLLIAVDNEKINHTAKHSLIQRVEGDILQHCSTTIVSKPQHSLTADLNTLVQNLAVISPNYITTWIDASITFENKEVEYTLMPTIHTQLSNYIKTSYLTGLGLGKNINSSSIYDFLISLKGISEVNYIRLNANQMRFTLPLNNKANHDSTFPKHINAGAQISIAVPDSIFADTQNSFDFNFLTARSLSENDNEIIVEGFKEGDTVILKRSYHLQGNNTVTEEILFASRVISIETHFFDNIEITQRSDCNRAISHFRIYLQPKSIRKEDYISGKTQDPHKNLLLDDTFIIAECHHGTFPLTGENKKVKTFVRRIIDSNNNKYCCKTPSGTADNYNSLINSDNKSLFQLSHEEVIVAIDVAIPNIYTTAYNEVTQKSCTVAPPLYIYPYGISHSIMTHDNAKDRILLHLDMNRIFQMNCCNSLSSNNTNVLFIQENTEHVFMGILDIPKPGNHSITTNTPSRGRRIKTQYIENYTMLPDDKSHIWYKSRFNKQERDNMPYALISEIKESITARIQVLENTPNDNEEELHILRILSNPNNNIPTEENASNRSQM